MLISDAITSTPFIAPYLQQIFEQVLHSWPEHEKFLEKRFKLVTNENLAFIEKLSRLIVEINAKRLNELVDGYRWMCNAVLEEELYFRRHHQYRVKKFEDALTHVYANPTLMTKYMDGLLLSGVLWSNHTSVLQFYAEKFLESISHDFRLLEIGPGHGIFLYFAINLTNCLWATGWDISQSSLDLTRRTLSRLSKETKYTLNIQNIFKIESEETFDVIVLSEILEHLENPLEALTAVKPRLTRDGKIFINVPCNSPAPDHIYLFRHPNEVLDLVSNCGYCIEHSEIYPATAVSLQRALDKSLTTSVVVIATN